MRRILPGMGRDLRDSVPAVTFCTQAICYPAVSQIPGGKPTFIDFNQDILWGMGGPDLKKITMQVVSGIDRAHVLYRQGLSPVSPYENYILLGFFSRRAITWLWLFSMHKASYQVARLVETSQSLRDCPATGRALEQGEVAVDPQHFRVFAR